MKHRYFLLFISLQLALGRHHVPRTGFCQGHGRQKALPTARIFRLIGISN